MINWVTVLKDYCHDRDYDLVWIYEPNQISAKVYVPETGKLWTAQRQIDKTNNEIVRQQVAQALASNLEIKLS